jgi:hypothetical protein
MLFLLRLQQIATCHRSFDTVQAGLYQPQRLKPHLNIFRKHACALLVDVPQPVDFDPAQFLPADIVCHSQHPQSPARRMPDIRVVVNFGPFSRTGGEQRTRDPEYRSFNGSHGMTISLNLLKAQLNLTDDGDDVLLMRKLAAASAESDKSVSVVRRSR